MKATDLTYKQRMVAVGVLSIAFVWLLWDRKLSITFDLIDHISVAEEQSMMIEDADYRISELEAEVAMIEAQIGQGEMKGNEAQNNLLEVTSSFCAQNGIVVIDFSEPHLTQANGFKFLTETIQLEGGFFEILKLSRHLEINVVGLRIASLEYRKVFDRKQKKDRLYAKLFVQTTYQP